MVRTVHDSRRIIAWRPATCHVVLIRVGVELLRGVGNSALWGAVFGVVAHSYPTAQ